MTYRVARFKQSIEQFGIFPLVLLGRLIGCFYRIDNPGGYFLIFPNRDTGGSIKVNAAIAALLKEKRPLVIFTKKDHNGGFRSLFNTDGLKLLDISKQTDNKLFHFINIIWRGIIATWVNSCPNPLMFGGESIFFYKLLPHVKKETNRVELCHVNRWLNYTQAFIPFIDARIFSTSKIRRDHEGQYRRNNIPPIYWKRLFFIDNKIEIPDAFWPQYHHLNVLFVGRGSAQKRVYLVAEIAKQVKAIRPEIAFTLIGDLNESIPEDLKPLVEIRSDITDPAKLKSFYRNSNVLILTSLFEGLPIVVMDMMAQGRVVMSTAVDSIPDYVHHLENGILISEINDEAELVKQAVAFLLQLDDNKLLVKRLSENARSFALAHFSSDVFDESYKNLLLKKYVE